MSRLMMFGASLCLVSACLSHAAEEPDLKDFRTVATAARTELKSGALPGAARTGYLGVYWKADALDKLVVGEVAVDSPAAKAGLLAGDAVIEFEGSPVKTSGEFRDRLQSLAPGKEIKLKFERNGKPVEVSAQVGATSSPLSLGRQRAVLGVQIDDATDTAGALIRTITDGQPAQKAGLKQGDIIAKVDGAALESGAKFRELLSGKAPGDMVKLLVKREESELEIDVQLAADPASGRGGANRTDPFDPSRGGFYWRRDVYRLAVVAVEFDDVKHNDKIDLVDWERSLFSEGRYLGRNITGQETYGSVNDYYRELSCGKFRVEGRLFDWVTASKKRDEYATGNRAALLTEALDKLLEREGKGALDDYDGLFFIYAGGRVQTNRGGLYWPHRATVNHRNKRWPYFIVQEGGSRMCDISVICHEFGHMLGLPDLYARPEQPGSEGVSVWCAMSQQNGGGRPQHFSAWCKERLGWLEPAIIDPTVPQKLILSPVESSTRECYKILIRPDGSEYLLLENRRKRGFDNSLPGEGLLIWRVVNNKPLLEESHGIEGPAGPGSFRDAVPYPSKSNTSFTPHTTPSSRSQLGGGLPVHITNILELEDGRVTFYVGYEFQ